jgi:hypothetical protein
LDISDILKQAVAATDAAGVPEDLRATAFAKAVDLLSSTMQVGVAPAFAPAPSAVGLPAGLARIATAFDVSPEQLDRIFDEFEGMLQFTGDVGALGKTQSARVAELALIYGAARQLGGYDEGASTDSVIRAEVDRHGLLDSSNYTKHIAPLKPYFNINGSGKSATYKLKYDGRQHAKSVAQGLVN